MSQSTIITTVLSHKFICITANVARVDGDSTGAPEPFLVFNHCEGQKVKSYGVALRHRPSSGQPLVAYPLEDTSGLYILDLRSSVPRAFGEVTAVI